MDLVMTGDRHRALSMYWLETACGIAVNCAGRRGFRDVLRRSGARCGVGVAVAVLAMQLTACGSTIRPDKTAEFITDKVSHQTGFQPTDVTCPSGVDAKVGGEFDCHFTGPDGPYTVHMRITKVDGEDVVYDWKSVADDPKIAPDKTAEFITDKVSQQTGFQPTDVTCPSGVEAKVGGEFDCHFTGPDGPYTVHMRITKVDGDDIVYDWKSIPDHPAVSPEGAAQAVVNVVSQQTGFHPTDVTCPTGVEAIVGGEFECHFTGPDGPYTARMHITKVDGTDVEFDIESRPS
jgi:Domain of unknown function (DUF4333)